MAVYEVLNKDTGASRLVDSLQNHQALLHVTKDMFEITVAGPRRVGELVKQGIEIEDYVPIKPRVKQPELQEGRDV